MSGLAAQRDAVVMVRNASTTMRRGLTCEQVNFNAPFVSADPDSADVKTVADHVDYIASVTGRAQYVCPSSIRKRNEHWRTGSVGIGSDYDGVEDTPEGLEDVSTYPAPGRALLPFGPIPLCALIRKLFRSRNCTAVDGLRKNCGALLGVISCACSRVQRMWRARWRARASRRRRTYTTSARMSRRGADVLRAEVKRG